jgi:hypothetical protein
MHFPSITLALSSALSVRMLTKTGGSISHADSQRCTKALQYFYPKPPEREREATRVLFEFSSFTGLGHQVVLRALSNFGWEILFLVVDYLAERTERLKRPEGYFINDDQML